MVFFATEEWVKEVIEKINNNERFRKKAEDWEGDFLLTIKADHNIEKDLYVWLDISNGYVVDGGTINSPEDVQTDYTFEGSYENWKDLIEGKIELIKSTMAGKFRVMGDIAKIINSYSMIKRLLKVIQLVETEFY
jgi:putative sterol carrier protein